MQILLTEQEYRQLQSNHLNYENLKQEHKNLSKKYKELEDKYNKLLVFGVSNSNERLKGNANG